MRNANLTRALTTVFAGGICLAAATGCAGQPAGDDAARLGIIMGTSPTAPTPITGSGKAPVESERTASGAMTADLLGSVPLDGATSGGVPGDLADEHPKR